MSDDLISREALKEAVKGKGTVLSVEHIKYLIDNAPPVDPQKIVIIPPELIEKLASCVVDTIGNIDWDKAIEAYKAIPQGEWISVSERLPNICGVYNVTKRVIEGGRRYYIADSCYFDGTGTWHDDNRINFSRERVNCIIAWQPLPEPYKEAEK